ncbi:HPr kinase/phosphorylase [Bacillus pinisoli]|uniref:HPr kinase/phosphorylase n=1 Tax=Bacillus pinisoli TaxID=2901866 RepID=UPI001FF0FB8A|nr:aldolase [Bacillus pinisoli]
MLRTTSLKVYEAFGLTIYSDILLSALIEKMIFQASPDIRILVNDDLRCCCNGNPFEFVVTDQTVTFLVPDIAIFQINDGKEITVSPFEGANEDIIQLYTLGSCFGALLLQRGIYPLHGSAIAIDGKAYAIVGESGAGKSTLASAFMEKGYSLLSDDVIAVTFDKENQPIVIPSYPQQKLWQQSLDALGFSNDQLKPIYGRENKFCKPINEGFYDSPLPLGGIFELIKSDKLSSKMIQIQPIIGLMQLQKLYTHTYRQILIPKMELTEWHFRQSTLLSNTLPFHQIIRPEIGFSAFQIVDQVLTTIHSTEIPLANTNDVLVNR